MNFHCKVLMLIGLVAAGLMLALPLSAQDDFEDYGPKPAGAPEAKKQYEANLKAYKDSPDTLVLPGLVADRKERTVKILGEATGLAAGELIEFLLVDQTSSHGYEAVLWSFAKPSDVHRALQFIGLKPGAPFNPAMLRFWASGDRVTVELADEDETSTFPIEELILDEESGETLPAEGFVFAGSMMVPSHNGEGEPRYAADAYDPRSVASVYNEPAAVLDVPRQASKGDVYGHQVVNPDYALEGGQLVNILMTPADPDNMLPTRNLELTLSAGTSNKVACVLGEVDGKTLHKESTFKAMLEHLSAIGKQESETFVAVTFDKTLPIEQVAKSSVILALMENMGMLKITPPQAGQLYFRSFVPEKTWIKPDGRPTQPWELHVARGEDGKLAAMMVLNEVIWGEDALSRTFEPQEVPIKAPADVRKVLDDDAKRRKDEGLSRPPAVLLVFARKGMTYGEVLSFVTPALSTHGTVYVFVQ